MSEFSSDKNYYEILSLKEDCSTDEIRKSYKKLALKWHPVKLKRNINFYFYLKIFIFNQLFMP